MQYAAPPFRTEFGNLQILLITSREMPRWVIPKGWPIRGPRPREVVAREALEEALLVGRIAGKGSFGSSHYTKRLPDHREALCRAKAFLLSVDHQLDDWQEQAQRKCRWMNRLGELASLTTAASPRFFSPPFRRSGSRVPRRASGGASRTASHTASESVAPSRRRLPPAPAAGWDQGNCSSPPLHDVHTLCTLRICLTRSLVALHMAREIRCRRCRGPVDPTT